MQEKKEKIFLIRIVATSTMRVKTLVDVEGKKKKKKKEWRSRAKQFFHDQMSIIPFSLALIDQTSF
jgi:hypothetical protein